MVRRHLGNDRKGFIGTLNLAVMSLTIAVAMAGWIFGVSAIFIRMGRVEIESTYVARKENTFIISMKVKNAGGAEATIDNVFLNEELCTSKQLPLVLKTGQNEVLKLQIPVGKGIESGITVQVTLHTLEGFSCSTLAVLP